MTSQINYSNIDATFPVAGKDNDSQGFRDNFAAIKTSLSYASAEVTDLQNNAAVLNSANNFGGNQLYNAQFLYNSQTVYALGTVSGNVTIDYHNGQVQTLTTSGNITLSFTNFPTSGKAGELVLILTLGSGSHTITYPGSANTAGWANPTYAGVFLIDFYTINGGTTIYVSNKRGFGYSSTTVQTVTGAGAVDTTSGVTHLVTTGANAYTLENGSEGIIKCIVMKTDGGDATLTPTTKIGFTNIVFTAVGQTVRLQWTNSAWHVIGYFGVTIS